VNTTAETRGRWIAAALLLLVLVPVAFNAVALWPEVSVPVPSLNDDAVHYLVVQRASDALATGENPLDHWLPEIELGFPMFRYYQHLPQVAVVLLHRLLLKRLELFTVFNLVRYLILVAFPLVVYWSMRRMDFSVVAAAVAAAVAGLISGNGTYGFEYGSYIWRGHGMYTQLWAMPLSFITLACLDRLVDRGKGHVAAVLACSALALTHLIYAYMMVISGLVLLLVGASRANFRHRIARLIIVGLPAGIISSYVSVPFVLGKAYLSASAYLQQWKYDSFGAHDVLKWLVSGELFDAGRLPVLTGLLALGVAAALFSGSRPARVALTLFTVWVALYFGRPTWGRLVDVLPMHEGLLFHRFIGSVHVGAILLMGLGGEWLWRYLSAVEERWRVAAVALVALILLVPALRERRDHYATNAQWLERARRAIDADGDAQAILATLRGLPPGRTYVGLRADWGRQMQFGDLRFYDLLVFNRIVSVPPPYQGMSLNSDLIWHFNDHRLDHYDLFNVKYVVAPRQWPAPEFLRPLRETGRYTLYEAPTDGYGAFAVIVDRVSPASQSDLFFRNRTWFLSGDPGARRFVRYEYPSGAPASPAGGGVAAAVEGAKCPTGALHEELVSRGRIELRTECPVAATLVLKATYHPNWRVTVDGTEARPFMASPSFIGVELPPGPHRVRAEYRSGFLKTGLLTIGGLALIAVLVCRRRFAALEKRWASA
jgi:hypothetical protein